MHQGQTDDTLNFPKKIGFDISCKLSPNRDSLHELAK